MDCLFCKIANKEIPANIIEENDDAIAILDIEPKAPGHTMVLPKVHAETILDLPKEKIAPVFEVVQKVTGKLKKALLPDGFTLGINHGKNAGQAIDHLHIHIIPRYKGDNGGNIHSIVENPPKESIDEIKKKILSL